MGPWRALWLWLSLHRVLWAQTPVPLPVQPQLSQFHSEQFQGAWFVLGLAGNAFKKQDRPLLNPYASLFELRRNSHFEVSNSMTRGQRCDSWSYLLMPTSQPAWFTIAHGGPGTDTEQVQVVDTNYTSFALLLSRRQAAGHPVIRVSLLGRTWTLPPGTPDKFICLCKAQGLTRDNVAFLAMGRGRGQGQWSWQTQCGSVTAPQWP
ncbi:epididymal-specific lipocalin-12 isoform X1 [Octodon degus]|uniref:Epididymal-specific lipocalin-12 isoform X1 n=1 Tax=Octodon degus TaxID=10160 RepID=A0A6P6D8N2_OCTDE|nr:epididymal-specific lipocalin-12 isoform X1 [Octodon degus]